MKALRAATSWPIPSRRSSYLVENCVKVVRHYSSWLHLQVPRIYFWSSLPNSKRCWQMNQNASFYNMSAKLIDSTFPQRVDTPLGTAGATWRWSIPALVAWEPFDELLSKKWDGVDWVSGWMIRWRWSNPALAVWEPLHYGNIFEDNSPVYDTGDPFYSVYNVYDTGEFFTLFHCI